MKKPRAFLLPTIPCCERSKQRSIESDWASALAIMLLHFFQFSIEMGITGNWLGITRNDDSYLFSLSATRTQRNIEKRVFHFLSFWCLGTFRVDLNQKYLHMCTLVLCIGNSRYNTSQYVSRRIAICVVFIYLTGREVIGLKLEGKTKHNIKRYRSGGGLLDTHRDSRQLERAF